jgi:hypothetical protein
MQSRSPMTHSINSTNLADILERVLDKGIVVAGDIKVCLADVELLSIKIRLVICSVDKAIAIGINWWQNDPALSTGASVDPGAAMGARLASAPSFGSVLPTTSQEAMSETIADEFEG